MNEQQLSKLTQVLNTNALEGLEYFRDLFFEALERRHLDSCRALIDVLRDEASDNLIYECEYYESVLLSEQRQFDQAELRLIALLENNLAPVTRARALLALAISRDEQGRWSEAEQFYVESLGAYDAIQDQLGKAKVYNNLGIAICFQYEQGACVKERLHEALTYHGTALNIATEEGNLWEVAKNRRGMGMVYGLLEQFEHAYTEFQIYVTMCQQLDDPSDRAVGLSDMAAMALEPLGQIDKAKAALDEAIPVLTEYDDALNLAEALTRRGNLFVAGADFDQAQLDFDAAIEIAESVRTRLTAPTVQANYRSTVEYIYHAALSLYLQLGNAASAITVAERARSRVLADLLADQSPLPHNALPESLLSERKYLQEILDQAYSMDDTPTDIPLWEQSLDQINRQIELLDPYYGGLNSLTTLTAQEVQTLLPPASGLLAYTTDHNDRFWILMVTPVDVKALAVPDLSVKWLQGYISDHLEGIRQGIIVPEPTSGHLSSPQHLFSNLFSALIEPVWPSIKPLSTLYVIPTGPLFYLPLGALSPNLLQSPPLLSGGRRIIYAPSATVLFTYCRRRPRSSNESTLVVAPTANTLRFTEGSAKAISHLTNGQTLTDSSASCANFKRAAGRCRILSFLGHAVFDSRHPMQSRLQLSDGNLRASEILQELRLDADLVVLAACESGRGQVLRGDEILGLSRALLYAGTPCLLVTLWSVHEIPTRLLIEYCFQRLVGQERFDPAAALTEAQEWLRNLSFAAACQLMARWQGFASQDMESALLDLMNMTQSGTSPQPHDCPFAHPFFWAPYILIGESAATDPLEIDSEIVQS